MENLEIEKQIIVVLEDTKTALLQAKLKISEALQTIQNQVNKQTIELEKLDPNLLKDVSAKSPQIKSLLEQIGKISGDIDQLGF